LRASHKQQKKTQNMNTNETGTVETTDNNRRRFLKLAGAAMLAGAAVPQAAQASINHFGGDIRDGTSNTFFGGVVSNSHLGLILNVYLAIDPDGTGVGTLSDPVHSTVNSHLAVQRTAAKGNQIHCEGVVLASNGGTPIGQRFAVDGVMHENFTSLAVRMDDATFTGKGFIVTAPMFAIPGIGR
jgi:hypothetical protein